MPHYESRSRDTAMPSRPRIPGLASSLLFRSRVSIGSVGISADGFIGPASVRSTPLYANANALVRRGFLFPPNSSWETAGPFSRSRGMHPLFSHAARLSFFLQNGRIEKKNSGNVTISQQRHPIYPQSTCEFSPF
mmetsp:Transcript_26296/g.63125  ORF Transcript_26296/g.63125 Transcript_26296/m.63125 type:complete len:135 (-) Transcript_26296:682-1086(-)